MPCSTLLIFSLSHVYCFYDQVIITLRSSDVQSEIANITRIKEIYYKVQAIEYTLFLVYF